MKFNLRDVEQETILLALNHYDGHRTKTAKALGVSMRTLRNKLHIFRAKGIEVIPSAYNKD